jgi:hypothetical protein
MTALHAAPSTAKESKARGVRTIKGPLCQVFIALLLLDLHRYGVWTFLWLCFFLDAKKNMADLNWISHLIKPHGHLTYLYFSFSATKLRFMF